MDAEALRPDLPQFIHRRFWRYIFRRAGRGFLTNHGFDIAATLSFFAVLSLFPALIALVSLIGLLGRSEAAVNALLDAFEVVAPEGVVDIIAGALDYFSQTTAAGFGVVVGIAVAIWISSRYVTAFSRAINRVYGVREGRPFWKLKPLQLLITLIAVVLLLIVAIVLVISGPIAEVIGDLLGIGDTARMIWSLAQWPILAFAAISMVALLYYATPNVKQPKFRWMGMGAAVALLIITAASIGQAVYLSYFPNLDLTYGSVAGVLIFLLWIWFANIALIFGAHINTEVERVRQLQAGITAEEEVHLFPRDTRSTRRLDKRRDKNVATARAIRKRAAALRGTDGHTS